MGSGNDSLPTPLARGQEKLFAKQMNFLGLRPRGGHLIFGTSFDCSLCYPKGAHSWHHRWGHPPTKVGNFKFSMCYPKGVHSLGHRLGQFPPNRATCWQDIAQGWTTATPIMSYTHENLWTQHLRWCTPIFVFIVFSSQNSTKCISRHGSVRMLPQHSSSNLGRSGQNCPELA